MSRELIEQFVLEAIKSKKTGASKEYMKKEAVREKLQVLLQEAVESGEVKSQEELEDWWATVEMAKNALKMVPFAVWKR